MGKTVPYIYTQVAQVRPHLVINLEALALAKLQKDELARFLWQAHGTRICNYFEGRNDENLAKIAVCGLSQKSDSRTPLCFVMDEIDLRGEGRFALITLAAVTITAALTDVVCDELNKAEAKPKKADDGHYVCPYCTFTTEAFPDPLTGVKLESPYSNDGQTPWRKIILHVALSHEELARRNQDFGFTCR